MRNIKMYQLNEKEMENLGYRPYSSLEDIVKESNYHLVYEIEVAEDIDLEEVFELFNSDSRPADFTGHPLNVSDVLCVENKNYYYIDERGFEPITFEWKSSIYRELKAIALTYPIDKETLIDVVNLAYEKVAKEEQNKEVAVFNAFKDIIEFFNIAKENELSNVF